MESKKKNKKKKQRIKFFVIAVGLIICCSVVLTLFIALNNADREIFKVDSRISNITKEKKNDQDGYETVAWLKVQGTTIDAPIIIFPNEDEDYQIEYVDKENYLWNENPSDKLFNKVSIMGHNILNLSATPEVGLEYFSRFDDLMSFVYLDFVKDNKYVQYTIDGEDHIYKVFGVYFEKQYNLDIYAQENYTEEQMNEFLTNVENNTLFEFDVDVEPTDNVISLVTCTRMFGTDTKEKFVVVAREVREDEKLTNYSVKETNNYEAIKEILKGDDSDEEEA